MTSTPAIGLVLSPSHGGVAELHLPPIVHFGRGALAALGHEARGFGERALVVTDRGLAATGIVDQVVRVLRDAGVESLIFDRVEPNPTIAQVEAGLEAGAGQEIRVIVSVGGGAPTTARRSSRWSRPTAARCATSRASTAPCTADCP